MKNNFYMTDILAAERIIGHRLNPYAMANVGFLKKLIKLIFKLK